MSEFVARYPGRCGACGEDFPVGATVIYVDSVLVEFDCVDIPEAHWPQSKPVTTDMPLDRAKLCPSCFTVHGPGQVECS